MNPFAKFFIAIALISPLSSAAQQAEWSNLQQIPLGGHVRVLTRDGKSHNGRFQSASDSGLVIMVHDKDETFQRDSIQRVLFRSGGHRVRHVLIGAAVGAGAGLATGAAIDNDCSKNSFVCTGNMGKAILTPVFGLLGAGVGALFPSGGMREVYRSM
jgi:hypothetical protein